VTPPLWVGLVINLLVPLLGVIVFGLLCRKMNHATVPSPPYFTYFILFSVFGGWLVTALTVLFWMWSGMSSVGMLYLVGIAPFITALLAFRLRKQRAISGFHSWAYIVSLAYSGFGFVLFVAWLGMVFFVH
jgi:hypothetical protein